MQLGVDLRLRRLGVLVVVFAVLMSWGCKKKPSYIAELTKADGPVERQEGEGAWSEAAVGAKYYWGDAARTADGPAELKLGGAAIIKMEKYTKLRFGNKNGSQKIAVELGQIELRGTGKYGLDLGDVQLDKDGAVRITARQGKTSTIELLVGKAQVTGEKGNTMDLVIGAVLDLDVGPVVVETPVDAGVDAVEDAAVDAGAIAEDGTIEVVGKKAEIQMPGSTKWDPLPAGGGKIVPGATIRLGAGTTAKLVSGGVTLSLAGGSRMKIGSDLLLGLELGVGTASVPASVQGKVGVPGGTVNLNGTGASGAKARLDVNARGETKVSVLEGGVKLMGTAPGAELELKTGEAANMAKAGNIQQKAKIPDYYDISVVVGAESLITIHDPRGSTAVRFSYPGKCPNVGTIEMDTDARFRTARITAGKDGANILAEANAGAYSYRLTCGGGPVAQGKLIVKRDAGTRPLPKTPPVNPIDADGRTYRISYQSLVPDVKIKVPGNQPGNYKLHIATGGVDEVVESKKPTITVSGKQLKEATYTYYVEKDGVKADKVSTLIIDFDQTAPQVYISDPPNGKPFGAEVKVAGAVLPGWTAKVEGTEVPVHPTTRRFNATVGPPQGANALAIRLAHPQRGIHYYLRRAGK